MLSVLRIVAAIVFITFGTMKLFNVPPLPKGMPPISLMSQFGLAGTLEVVGGSLLLIGLLTPTAGTIEVDGIDLREVSPASRRRTTRASSTSSAST